MFSGDFGVPIASSCYRCIEITNLLHLMCPLFVMFGSRLNWDSPTPFFLCSHVLSLFLFWSRLNWDPPHPLLSLLTCALSFCFGPGLTGTHPTLFFLCSHVLFLSCFFGPRLAGTHPSFSEMHALEWFRCPDSQQLLSLHRNHQSIASHVSLVCNVWVPA